MVGETAARIRYGDYLAAERAASTRHEYVGGVVVAMAVVAGRRRSDVGPVSLACGVRVAYALRVVQPIKATVHNGRLVLDEPTDLPEGNVVELVLVDDVLANGGDCLDAEERAALHRELEASLAEVRAGKLVDADEVLAELRRAR